MHVSGDKLEFRESYIPTFVHRLFDPLSKLGAEGITEVINFMDLYHISKDDFDCINEIYMGKLPEIPTAVKSAFTRTYNKMSHPTVSSFKGGNGPGTGNGSKPDFDDILEDEEVPDEEEEEDKMDGKMEDKMIKIPKKKETKKETKKSKGKGKKEK